MKNFGLSAAVCVSLAACGDGNPFPGSTTSEGGEDVSTGSAYLTEAGSFLTLNNVTYDQASDTLTLNNIPFDDPNNAYVRVPTESFSNGFDAYQSDPAPGSNELQYFAVFRRSDSGRSQVAAAGTNTYIDFGYGGAGAQRIGSDPNLPASGIYSYNGEYAAVRTASNNAGNTVEFVTGDAALAVDFDDFDTSGAVGGTIQNRTLYNSSGVATGALAGFISLQDTDIDFDTGSIEPATATEISGSDVRTGTWQGVFAGPSGEEVAGILFVEDGDFREVGGFIATQ